MSISSLLGPVAANLCDSYGCRLTAIFGGVTCVLGLLLTSQAPNIFCMYLTYSVIVGFGTCCVYTASFVVVPRYFLKRRALATGIVSCGPAGGALVMGPLLQLLLDTTGWRNTFIAMAGMASVICLLALVYDRRTAQEISTSEELVNTETRDIVMGKKQSTWCRDIFTNPTLVTWTVCCGVAFLGLYNPQVLLVKYAEQQGLSADKSAMFFCYMGLASAVARITTGRVCDLKFITAQAITQGALYIISGAMCLLPFASTYYQLVAYSLVFGFCDGCYGSSINFQVIGCVKSHFTSRAFGLWLGVTSPSMAAGPPIAGFVADRMDSYAPAFYMSAAFVFVAATVPCFLCCFNYRNNSNILQVELLSIGHLLERETVL
ncbi:monocarboxylate transporter 12-like isoform X2 [Montipora capricornis]